MKLTNHTLALIPFEFGALTVYLGGRDLAAERTVSAADQPHATRLNHVGNPCPHEYPDQGDISILSAP